MTTEVPQRRSTPLAVLIVAAVAVLLLLVVAAMQVSGKPPAESQADVAEGKAVAALRQLSGFGCVTAFSDFGPPPDADPRAADGLAKLRGADGWVVDGSIYAGDAQSAAAAFGGEVISQSIGVQWIITDSNGTKSAVMIAQSVADDGQEYWAELATITAVECSTVPAE
ncbi:MAG: hypothetical protein ACRDHD_08695 [Candidatus Limnocylindria bacterium]